MGGEGGKLGFWSVFSIGVGGMVGGGIFAVLGLAAQLAHGSTPIAFFIAGIVALSFTRCFIMRVMMLPEIKLLEMVCGKIWIDI